MCGIVAAMTSSSTGFFNNQIDAFQEMLFVDELRGKHGTGIFYDDKKRKINIIKGPLPAHEFLSCENVDKAFKDVYQESSFVVGHNRHATRGAHVFENTHPFRVNHITLIHNGTLTSHKDLKDVEVDSHAICHSMAEIGEEATLKKINGAFALVWFNSIDKTLNFIRNNERPLHLIEVHNGYYLSSELGLAEWIIKRNKGTVLKTEMLEVGQLYTFDPVTKKISSRKVDIKAPFYSGKWSGGAYDHYSGYNAYDDYGSGVKSNINYLAPSASATATISALPPPSNQEVYTYNPNHKIGSRVTFTPIQIHQSGKTQYLEGLCDDPLDAPDVYVRLYNSNRDVLADLLKCTTLQGTIMQVIKNPKQKETSLVIKDVKRLTGMEIPGNNDYADANDQNDQYVVSVLAGVH